MQIEQSERDWKAMRPRLKVFHPLGHDLPHEPIAPYVIDRGTVP